MSTQVYVLKNSFHFLPVKPKTSNPFPEILTVNINTTVGRKHSAVYQEIVT